jgi:hypothetical protein
MTAPTPARSRIRSAAAGSLAASAGIDTTVNGIGAAVYCLARFLSNW